MANNLSTIKSVLNGFLLDPESWLEPYSFAFDVAGFPPVDIHKSTDGNRVVEMALAGLSPDDVKVEVVGDTLWVSCDKQESSEQNDNFQVRRIARRSFKKAFKLSEGMEVTDATMKDGLLSITVSPRKVDSKRIAIKG